MDSAHLEVAGLGAFSRGGGKGVNHMLGSVVARLVDGGGSALGFLVMPVGERGVAFIQKHAPAREAIDGAAAGKMVVARRFGKRFGRIDDTLCL